MMTALVPAMSGRAPPLQPPTEAITEAVYIASGGRGVGHSVIGRVIEELRVATIIIRAGTTYRGVKYAHDTARIVPDDIAERMLKEGAARPVPPSATDRADAAAEAFRQLHAAAMTLDEVLRRNDRLNESVPANWPLPMGAAEFAAACEAMVAHYAVLAA